MPQLPSRPGVAYPFQSKGLGQPQDSTALQPLTLVNFHRCWTSDNKVQKCVLWTADAAVDTADISSWKISNISFKIVAERTHTHAYSEPAAAYRHQAWTEIHVLLWQYGEVKLIFRNTCWSCDIWPSCKLHFHQTETFSKVKRALCQGRDKRCRGMVVQCWELGVEDGFECFPLQRLRRGGRWQLKGSLPTEIQLKSFQVLASLWSVSFIVEAVFALWQWVMDGLCVSVKAFSRTRN